MENGLNKLDEPDSLILEGIVTTLDPSGEVHIAPMGPRVNSTMEHFLLRPFNSSQTYRNLKAKREGVLNVTDDVLLLARAALGQLEPPPMLFAASRVQGFVLQDVCRYFEFKVRIIDDREERSRIEAEVVHFGRLRDFLGFNRAKHAVIEAAILATRTKWLPLEEIDTEYRKLAGLIDKTGSHQERRAFEFLSNHLAKLIRIQAIKTESKHS